MNRKQGKRRTPLSSMGMSKVGGNAAKSITPPRRKHQRVNQESGIAATLETRTSFWGGEHLPREPGSRPSASEIYSQSATEALDLPLSAGNESSSSRMTGAPTGASQDDTNTSQRRTFDVAVNQTTAHSQTQVPKLSQKPRGKPLAFQNDGSRRAVKGTQGRLTREFQPTYVDRKGKLHHGSKVQGAFKSVECKIHKSHHSLLHDIDNCSFAHSWKGDTRQFVCTECTKQRKQRCTQKLEHEKFIWNLGAYRDENGTIWKGSQT